MPDDRKPTYPDKNDRHDQNKEGNFSEKRGYHTPQDHDEHWQNDRGKTTDKK